MLADVIKNEIKYFYYFFLSTSYAGIWTKRKVARKQSKTDKLSAPLVICYSLLNIVK